MYERLLCTSALALGVAAAAAPAAVAQQGFSCGARGDIVGSLGAKYGETWHGGEPAGSTAVIEFYASDTTGNWTILLTDIRGVSCIMAVGDGWSSDAVAAPMLGGPA